MRHTSREADRNARFDALFAAGTTWTGPPILSKPSRTVNVNGRKLLEFFNDGKLSLVAWKGPGAAYWVSNTLTGAIPAGQLLAIAASLRPVS